MFQGRGRKRRYHRPPILCLCSLTCSFPSVWSRGGTYCCLPGGFSRPPPFTPQDPNSQASLNVSLCLNMSLGILYPWCQGFILSPTKQVCLIKLWEEVTKLLETRIKTRFHSCKKKNKREIHAYFLKDLSYIIYIIYFIYYPQIFFPYYSQISAVGIVS